MHRTYAAAIAIFLVIFPLSMARAETLILPSPQPERGSVVYTETCPTGQMPMPGGVQFTYNFPVQPVPKLSSVQTAPGNVITFNAEGDATISCSYVSTCSINYIAPTDQISAAAEACSATGGTFTNPSVTPYIPYLPFYARATFNGSVTVSVNDTDFIPAFGPGTVGFNYFLYTNWAQSSGKQGTVTYDENTNYWALCSNFASCVAEVQPWINALCTDGIPAVIKTQLQNQCNTMSGLYPMSYVVDAYCCMIPPTPTPSPSQTPTPSPSPR